MRKLIILSLITLLLFSCNNPTPTQSIIQEDEPVDVQKEEVLSESEIKELERKRQEEEDYQDTIAIGNIRLNTTKDVFELEKKQFLEENKTLGSLKIKSVTGFFWKDRLAAVQIVSQDNSFYREQMAKGTEVFEASTIHWELYGKGEGWVGLYYLKYKERYSNINSRVSFNYVKGRKGIRVTDYCCTSTPYTSFDNLVKAPFPYGWHGQGLYSPKRFEDSRNAFGGNNIMLAVENWSSVTDVLEKLPRARAKQLEARLGINPDYRTCQEIYNIAIEEANAIILHENEIGYRKHKDDPSYSIVIIGYVPAFEDCLYQERKRKDEERLKTLKELEKI